MKQLIIIAALLLSSPLAAQENIDKKINLAQSRFEIMNSLGLSCDGYLRVLAAKGIEKEPCAKLIKNMTGNYMQEVANACTEITAWSTTLTSSTERAVLIKAVQAKKICNPSNYPYITKTISKMNNLRVLE